MRIAEEQVAPVLELYERGQYLAAFEQTRPWGALHQWEGIEAQLFAGRLAANLGAPRLGRALHRWNWRRHPQHPFACYLGLWSLLGRRGPLTVWRWLERQAPATNPDDELASDFLMLRARVVAMLRDFETAEKHAAAALALDPDDPWMHVERSAIYELEDRPAQALEAIDRALELRPWYRPAVQFRAYLLVQQSRDDEALEFLQAASQKIQSGDVIAQWAALQSELGDHDAARRNYQRIEDFYPLLPNDKHMRQWLLARQADEAYHCGDLAEAAQLSKLVDTPFHQSLAERLLQEGADGKVVLLPVGFVRQHHMTCAPATLSAISGYWQRPVEHLEVAESICYDGTPAHSERRWAEEQGYIAREFRVTSESAAALLDRGLPFTLTTVVPGAAHLQAVIGYDQRRGVLTVRDPNERHSSEYLGEQMLKHQSSTGPRGMVMVPQAERERLDGVELPDADLYDLNYRLQTALTSHDRAAAQLCWEEMERLAPEHRLTIYARSVIAHYDGDLPQMLECTNRLLELFPDDTNQLLAKLRLLRDLGRREARVEMLQEICQRPNVHPMFWHQYAQDLIDDSRVHDEGRYWLRRAMRARPGDAADLRLMGSYLWEQDDRRAALALLRFAACLEDKHEGFAMAYFSAARHCHEAEAAQRFLEDRFERYGAKSSWPARTLMQAYEQIERTDQGFEMLDRALELRSDDGELLLYVADTLIRYGRRERGEQLLAQAKERSHRIDWLRSSAYAAMHDCNLAAALDFGRQVLQAEPLDRGMHELVVGMLRDADGPEAAEAHLRAAVAAFPHHYALRMLLIETLGRDDPQRAEAEVRELLRLHPLDVWGQRELAVDLWIQRRLDEALAAAETAVSLDPRNADSHRLAGQLLAAMGREEEAKARYRQAIRLSVDCDDAIIALIDACDAKADRLQELDLVYEQLREQVIFGDGLLTYRDYAANAVEPEELLRRLREAQAARPDLWHAWSALVRQLVEMERNDEALEVAQAAAARFPLLPRIWLDLARVRRAAKDDAGEIEALQQGLSINPNWGEALRQLAEAHERSGALDKAEAVLRRAIAANSREVVNQGALADILWQKGMPEAALQEMSQAVRREPRYDWGWRRLRQWAREAQQPELPTEIARELTAAYPHKFSTWMVLAEILEEEGNAADEALAALDRAVELSPFAVDAHSARARLLAATGQVDEALRACRPEQFPVQPLVLKAREADLEAQRGDLDRGIQLMREVVRDDADYTWAWYRLADWFGEKGWDQDYLEAGEQMVRLASQNEMAWGYRGHARQKLGLRGDAKADYRHAIELDPKYEFALRALFEMEIGDRELGAAAQSLEKIKIGMAPEFYEAFAIQLAFARDNPSEARAAFERLAASPLEHPAALGIAVESFRDAGRRREIQDLLNQQMNDPQSHPAVGEAWAEVIVETAAVRDAAKLLRNIVPERPIWAAACARLIERLIETGNAQGVDKLVAKLRKPLHANLKTWEAVGKAYRDMGRDAQAISWLGDWRQRTEVEPQMIFPLAMAQLSQKRYAAARATISGALGLPPDYSIDFHRLWLTVLLIERSEFASAGEQFAKVQRGFQGYYFDLHWLLGLTLKALEAKAGADVAVWREFAEQLRKFRMNQSAASRGDALFRRVVYLCEGRVARQRRRWGATLLAYLNRVTT